MSHAIVFCRDSISGASGAPAWLGRLPTVWKAACAGARKALQRHSIKGLGGCMVPHGCACPHARTNGDNCGWPSRTSKPPTYTHYARGRPHLTARCMSDPLWAAHTRTHAQPRRAVQVPLSYDYAGLIPQGKQYTLRDAISKTNQMGMQVGEMATWPRWLLGSRACGRRHAACHAAVEPRSLNGAMPRFYRHGHLVSRTGGPGAGPDEQPALLPLHRRVPGR